MIRLPRTLRLDPSDTLVFPRAAQPGEWAIPGGFAFRDDTDATLTGKRLAAFRAGFLGLSSFGWATLVEVADVTAAQRDAAVAALAAAFLADWGAPGLAAAREAAEEEIAFAAELCAHPPGTVLALTRTQDDGGVRERFRTLARRAGAAPVFDFVQTDEPPDAVDLTRLGR